MSNARHVSDGSGALSGSNDISLAAWENVDFGATLPAPIEVAGHGGPSTTISLGTIAGLTLDTFQRSSGTTSREYLDFLFLIKSVI